MLNDIGRRLLGVRWREVAVTPSVASSCRCAARGCQRRSGAAHVSDVPSAPFAGPVSGLASAESCLHEEARLPEFLQLVSRVAAAQDALLGLPLALGVVLPDQVVEALAHLPTRAGGGHIVPRSSGVRQHLVREGMPPLPAAVVHAQSELTDDAAIWINV
jgi:hypothetical protein